MSVELDLWVVDDTERPWRVEKRYPLRRHYGDQDVLLECESWPIPDDAMPTCPELRDGRDGYGRARFMRAGALPEAGIFWATPFTFGVGEGHG